MIPTPETLPVTDVANFSVVGISLREIRLANFYAETGNATEAAQLAGITSTDDRAASQRDSACILPEKFSRPEMTHVLIAGDCP